jgi:hypothetical protein
VASPPFHEVRWSAVRKTGHVAAGLGDEDLGRDASDAGDGLQQLKMEGCSEPCRDLVGVNAGDATGPLGVACEVSMPARARGGTDVLPP